MSNGTNNHFTEENTKEMNSHSTQTKQACEDMLTLPAMGEGKLVPKLDLPTYHQSG
jgi:hypothetical protein